MANPLLEDLYTPSTPATQSPTFRIPGTTNPLLLDGPGQSPRGMETNPLIGEVSGGGAATSRPLPSGDGANLVLQAISRQETGGRYEAVGYTNIPGQGRALGRYQFMPQTLIALGYGSRLGSPNPRDYQDPAKAAQLARGFLGNPQLQDEAARLHIQNLAKGLGIDLSNLTEKDIARLAAAWVGGAGMAISPERWGRSRVGPGLSTTVQEYVNNVLNNARRLAQAPRTPQPPSTVPVQAPGSLQAGLQPGGVPQLHPIDTALLGAVRRAGEAAAPAVAGVQKGVETVGQAVTKGVQMVPAPIRRTLGAAVAPPLFVIRAYKDWIGTVSGFVLKHLDVASATILGAGVGVISTFAVPNQKPITFKNPREDTFWNRTIANLQAPLMTPRPEPFTEQLRNLPVNVLTKAALAAEKSIRGQGLGSLDAGAELADFLLPVDLKRSQAARYSLGFGLSMWLDPLRVGTPETIARFISKTGMKVPGVGKVTANMMLAAEEKLYGTKIGQIVSDIFKRYPDMPVEYRYVIMNYAADKKGVIERYGSILEETDKFLGRNPQAQELLSKYVENAANAGVRKTLYNMAVKQFGQEAADHIQRIGDQAAIAGLEMKKYGLSKGWFSEDEVKKYWAGYLRLTYDRYLQPEKFIEDLRRANVPEEWVPRVFDRKLRSRLSNIRAVSVTPGVPGVEAPKFLTPGIVNQIVADIMSRPGRPITEWVEMAAKHASMNKGWNKLNPQQQDDIVEEIVNLISEPVTVGKQKSFLLVRPGPPGLRTPGGAPIPAGERIPSSIEIAGKVEQDLAKQAHNRDFMTLRSLRRQMSVWEARKDIPEEIKQGLGVVKEFGRRFGRQVEVFAREKATQEALESIASQAMTKAQLDAIDPKLATSGRWKPVIGGDAARLGPLWRDLSKGEEPLYIPRSFERWMMDMTGVRPATRGGYQNWELQQQDLLKRATSAYKRILVPGDPGATFRNFVSTYLMVDYSTGGELMSRPGLIPWAWKSALGNDPFAREVSKYGDFGADTFASADIRAHARIIRQADDKAYWKHVLSKNAQELWDTPVKVYGRTEATMRLAHARIHAERLAKSKGQTFDDLLKNPNLFTHDEWNNLAEQAINSTINYGDVPYWVEAVRSNGLFFITPFLTFSWKIGPRLADALYRHPTTVLKYPRMIEAINQSVVGEQNYENLAKISPEYLRYNSVLMVPYRGGVAAVNMGWFLPQTALDEIARDPGRTVMGGLFLNIMQQLKYNEDFVGRPIYDPYEAWPKNAAKIAAHIVKSMGLAGDAYNVIYAGIVSNRMDEENKFKAGGVPRDRYGARIPDTLDAVLAAGGLRPYHMEPEPMRTKRARQLKFEINEISMSIRKAAIELQEGRITPEDYKAREERYMAEIAKRGAEIQYIFNLPILLKQQGQP